MVKLILYISLSPIMSSKTFFFKEFHYIFINKKNFLFTITKNIFIKLIKIITLIIQENIFQN